MGTLFVDKLDPQSGTSLEIGSSGDTMTVPSGATLTIAGTINASSGTATGFGNAGANSFLATQTANQTISNSTWTKVTLATELFDTDSNFASNKFTVPTTGVYHFSFGGQIDFNGSNGTYIRFALYINGSGDSQQSQCSSGGALSYSYDNYEDGKIGSISFSLSQNDYVELYAIQNSGGNATLYDDVFLSGFRVA